MYAIDVEVNAFPTTIWDVLTGVGTIGAVLVALALGLHQNKASKDRQSRELERLEVERDEARAAQTVAEQSEATRRKEEQARLIGLWVVKTPREDVSGSPSSTYLVKFANYSQAAIFDVAAFPEVSSDSEASLFSELQPEKHNSVSFDGGVHEMTFVLTFRDIQGARWRRFQDGSLRAE